MPNMVVPPVCVLTVKADHLTRTQLSDATTIDGFHIVNVHKPPSANWDLQVLPTLQNPAIYVGLQQP